MPPHDAPSLALLTDLYQLTMAEGYWKLGRADEQAAFHLEFRDQPFGGGFAIACGLQQAVDYISTLRFGPDDLAYLRSVKAGDGTPLFEPAFLDYLGQLRLTVNIDAAPEGTVVFANEPILRVTGSMLQAQLLETPLLNLINFQTLVATKGARICQAAQGDPVIEFGLRRAQGIDGGLAASRAAYVGGCTATSNVLAGQRFGIPVKGTHAHSWVMSFDSEDEAFERWARIMPHNTIFLVDTYHTLDAVRKVARLGQRLEAAGHSMTGIRLDSGDLAYLSIEARRILDAHGLEDAKILASGDLDEHVIQSLKQQGAKIDLWGVGTRLATAYDQPALGGVYKLSAVRRSADEPWRPTLKLSEQAIKINHPGVLNVRRYFQNGRFMADMIYDETLPLPETLQLVDPADPTRRRRLPADARHVLLLEPIFRAGKRVYDCPPLVQSRQRAVDQLAALDPTIKRFLNPHVYPVGLERSLHERKTQLILRARGLSE